MDECRISAKKEHPTWKNGWLKLILQKKPVRLNERMAGCMASLQIKWHTTLKNERMQMVFWKKNNIVSIKM